MILTCQSVLSALNLCIVGNEECVIQLMIEEHCQIGKKLSFLLYRGCFRPLDVLRVANSWRMRSCFLYIVHLNNFYKVKW